jgi:hypothetical protein
MKLLDQNSSPTVLFFWLNKPRCVCTEMFTLLDVLLVNTVCERYLKSMLAHIWHLRIPRHAPCMCFSINLYSRVSQLAMIQEWRCNKISRRFSTASDENSHRKTGLYSSLTRVVHQFRVNVQMWWHIMACVHIMCCWLLQVVDKCTK